MLISVVLFIINAADLVAHRIGNRILTVLALITVLHFIFVSQNLLGVLAGAFIFSFPFLLTYALNKRVLGAGDVKFSMLAGALVGYWFSMVLLLFTGLGFAAYLYWKYKRNQSIPEYQEIPFAPFISIPLLFILIGRAIW